MIYFAIAIYRCYVASEYTGSIDIQCLYFEKDSAEEVRLAVHERGNEIYTNYNGEVVEWILDEIVTIEDVMELISGNEVIGFVCHENKFIKQVGTRKIEHHEVSDEELEEIKRRCDAATPGPWISYIEGRDHLGGDSVIVTGGEDIYLTGGSNTDQDFIAHARQDIPKLIQEVRRLRGLFGK